jgi:hypothetical protein
MVSLELEFYQDPFFYLFKIFLSCLAKLRTKTHNPTVKLEELAIN